MSCLCNNFSIIFDGRGRMDIGLRSDTLFANPSFFIGVTEAIFHALGKVSVLMQ